MSSPINKNEGFPLRIFIKFFSNTYQKNGQFGIVQKAVVKHLRPESLEVLKLLTHFSYIIRKFSYLFSCILQFINLFDFLKHYLLFLIVCPYIKGLLSWMENILFVPYKWKPFKVQGSLKLFVMEFKYV